MFLKKQLLVSLLLFLALIVASDLSAMVYVYEVTTETRRFQTVSRMQPDAFVYYNGGPDIIYKLDILGIYPNRDYDKVLEGYGLNESNNKQLLHQPTPRVIPYQPYYWWR